MANAFPSPGAPPTVEPVVLRSGQILTEDVMTSLASTQNWGLANIGTAAGTTYSQWIRKGYVVESNTDHGPFDVLEFGLVAPRGASTYDYDLGFVAYTTNTTGSTATVTFTTLEEDGTPAGSLSLTLLANSPHAFYWLPFTTPIHFWQPANNPTNGPFFARVRVSVEIETTDTFRFVLLGVTAAPQKVLSPLAESPVVSTHPTIFDGKGFEPLSPTTYGWSVRANGSGQAASTALAAVLQNNIRELQAKPRILVNKGGPPLEADPDSWWGGLFPDNQYIRIGLNRGFQGASFAVRQGIATNDRMPATGFIRQIFVAALLSRYPASDVWGGGPPSSDPAEGRCRIVLSDLAIDPGTRLSDSSEVQLVLTPPEPLDPDNPVAEWRFDSFPFSDETTNMIPNFTNETPMQVVGTHVVGPNFTGVGFENLFGPDRRGITDCFIQALVIWGV